MLKSRVILKSLAFAVLTTIAGPSLAQDGRPPHEGKSEDAKREEARREREHAPLREALRKDGPEFFTSTRKLPSAADLSRGDSGQLAPNAHQRNAPPSGGEVRQRTIPLPGAKPK
jgi:hypothetical protein